MITNEETKKYIKELSKETRFREKDLYLFLEDGIITGGRERDITVLALLEKVFFSRKYAKRILSYLSKSQRAYLLKTCELSKPEAFVLKRLENNNVKRIYRELVSQLRQFYGLSETQAKKVISKMARKARMRRYYKRKKQEE